MRHDGIRDFLSGLLSTVQNDQTEPPLQEIKTAAAPLGIGNTADQARLDIRPKGFWRSGQDNICNLKVINTTVN